VVESFDRQATEAWLLRMLEQLPASHPEQRWTFFCTLGKAGIFDDRVRSCGGTIVHSRVPLGDTIRFMRHLRATIARGGFHAVHSHHDLMGALPLLASLGLPLRARIVHVHNTTLDLPTSSVVKRRLLREPLRQVCLRYADKRVGVSRAALQALLQDRTPIAGRDEVVYVGIDTTAYRPAASDAHTRTSLGIETNVQMLLFAGRMVADKNPLWVVKVLAELAGAGHDVVAVFAGDGPLVAEVAREAARRGVSSRIRLLGFRDDLPALMKAANLLLSPGDEQVIEGLGLTVVEAQAAGLRVLMSRSVPADAIVNPDLVTILGLARGAVEWARMATHMLSLTPPDRAQAYQIIQRSPFALSTSVDRVVELYKATHA
jgi:glycosyltransferase EpsF